MSNLVSFRVGEDVITVEKVYVENSPFLVKILETEVSVDKDEEGHIILDVDVDTFNNYVSFLKGDDFKMDEEDEAFFDFMGHENRMQYPLEFWKVKLQDNWIRNNMYRLELWKDPYYGLIEVPIKRYGAMDPINGIENYYIAPVGTVVAGSAALWMAGYVSRSNDIDHFFVCPKDEAEKILATAIENQDCDVGKHAITCSLPEGYGTMQYILRLYKAPTEVVHGFDVDCCGILYDPVTMKLWATKRALYAIENKINYFDPERASPSYEWRLCKYKTRGYDIGIPLLTEDKVNVKPLFTRLADLFFTDGLAYLHQGQEALDLDAYIEDTEQQVPSVEDVIECISFKLKCRLGNLGMDDDQANLWRGEIDLATDHLFDKMYAELHEHLNVARKSIVQQMHDYHNLHMSVNPLVQEIASHASIPLDYITLFKVSEHMKGYLHKERIWGTIINILRGSRSISRGINACDAQGKVGELIPRDPASILILSKFYNISTWLWKQSDYAPDTKVQKMKHTVEKVKNTSPWGGYTVHHAQPIVSEIQWKEQDPMTQVTSTFHPTPIPDMYAWLSQSPLYLQ